MARNKWYAVQRGRRVGIYRTWTECEAQVKGYRGAVYKSFATEEEARLFIKKDAGISVADHLATNDEIHTNKNVVDITASTMDSNENIGENVKNGYESIHDIPPSHMVAYIDGSFDKMKGIVGAGGIIFYNGEEIPFSFGTKDPMYTTFWNVAGELLAAMHVMDFAVQKGAHTCSIYYDYMGIEMWATKRWKCNNDLTRQYSAFATSIMKQVSIHFCKVKAHTGDTYNEIADQLAKKGTLI